MRTENSYQESQKMTEATLLIKFVILSFGYSGFSFFFFPETSTDINAEQEIYCNKELEFLADCCTNSLMLISGYRNVTYHVTRLANDLQSVALLHLIER